MTNKHKSFILRAVDLALAAENMLKTGNKLPLELTLALNQFRFSEQEFYFELQTMACQSAEKEEKSQETKITVAYWDKKH